MTRPTFTLSITHDNIIQATQLDGKMTKPVSLPPGYFSKVKGLANSKADSKEIGKALYDLISVSDSDSDSDLLKEIKEVIKSALENKDNLRLRLDIEPPDLAALPWEMLYDGNNWLAANGHRSIVRTTAKQTQVDSLAVNKLNILLVGASPKNRRDLKIQRIEEIDRLLNEAVEKKQLKRQQIECKQLLDATWEQVSHELARNYYHVLYFIGHGTPIEIYFDDGEGAEIKDGHTPGDSYPVTVPMLADALKKNSNLRLLFLAACDTAKYEQGSSFATNLLAQTSLPVLVAMQAEVDDDRANLLAARFFIALASFDEVDVALTEARTALQTSDDISPDAFAPVMYLQANDGRLFKAARNWAALGLAALLAVVLVIAGIGGSFLEGQRATEEQARLAAQTSEAIAQATGKAEATQRVYAQETGQAEAIQRVIARETANAEATGKAVEAKRADEEERVALSRRLASQALEHLDDNLDLALLLSLESNHITNTYESKNTILTALQQNPRLITSLRWGVQSAYDGIMELSPNGKILATGGVSNTVVLWDITTQQPIGQRLTGQLFRNVIFSPNSKILATIGFDDNVILWDINTQQIIHKIRTTWEGIAFSSDSKTLAVDNGKNISLWNVDTGEQIDKPIGSEVIFSSKGKYSPDSKYLVVINGNDIDMYDAQGKYIHTFIGHKDGVQSIAFSSDSKILAAGFWDDTIILYDISSKQKINELIGHTKLPFGIEIFSLAFTPDSKTLIAGSCGEFNASGCLYTRIRLWDVTNKQFLEKEIDSKINGFVKTLTFGTDKIVTFRSNTSLSPDGKILAVGECGEIGTGGCQGQVRLWNTVTNQQIGQPFTGQKERTDCVAFSPDSKILASATRKNSIFLWEVETGNFIKELKGANCVAFSPNGKDLATGHTLYKNYLSDNPTTIDINQNGIILSVAFSSDGSKLATDDGGKNINLWNAETGQNISQMKGHVEIISKIVFNPDGQTLASTGQDGTVILWDILTGQPIGLPLTESGAFSKQPVFDYKDDIDGLIFSPDGSTLASYTIQTKAIHLWDIDLETWKDRACHIANRNLTLEEWKTYLGDKPYYPTCPYLPLPEGVEVDLSDLPTATPSPTPFDTPTPSATDTPTITPIPSPTPLRQQAIISLNKGPNSTYDFGEQIEFCFSLTIPAAAKATLYASDGLEFVLGDWPTLDATPQCVSGPVSTARGDNRLELVAGDGARAEVGFGVR